MSYKEIQEKTESGKAFLQYLETQILKNSTLAASHGSAFVGSMCVLVCPKKLWISYCPY